MKKAKIKVRYSKKPPHGWPTEEQWAEAEKELAKHLPTRINLDNVSPVYRAKQDICAHFVRYFNESKITQRELAAKLGVTESRVSEIIHYHHDRFTIDKLLELLVKLKPEIRIKVA